MYLGLTKRLIKQKRLGNEFLQFIEELEPTEVQAIADYVEDYEELNKELRSGGVTSRARQLMDIFAKAPVLPRDMTLYRTVVYDRDYPEPADGEYTLKGFVSTVTNADLKGAPIEENSTVLVISVPAGVPVIPWGEMGSSEMLLPHGIKGEFVTSEEPFEVPGYRSFPMKYVDIRL